MRKAAKCRLLPSGDHRAGGNNVRFGDSEISDVRLYPPLAKPPDQVQATQLGILRRRVMEYWVDGVLKHSLHSEVLISLGKRRTDEAVDAPWKYSVEVSDSLNSPPLDNRDVSAIYDATGLLLILGEPGSGKTTTLLELARTLLERAKGDIKERVPVVLNLSSWKKKQPLGEWISHELSEKYRVPRKIARFWLEHDYLLPLLDGLDEVEISIQPDCVAAINGFIDEQNPSGLVVCCRLNEYRWLPERLKLNGAICLEPLSENEVAEYLARGGPALAGLRDAVNTDSVLQELAQTPLMLSIMSLASQGGGGDELAKKKRDSPEERRKQIFRLYVEQMFQRKGMTSLVFPKEKIIGWLSWLAREMREHSQSVFIVEGLQPSWLGTRTQQQAYRHAVILSNGLIFGVVGGLIGGLVGDLSNIEWQSILGGLVGLIVGLMVGYETVGEAEGKFGNQPRVSLSPITLVETMSWSWNECWRRNIRGFIVWLSLGAIGALICGSPIGGLMGAPLILGLVFGMVAGLIGGVVGLSGWRRGGIGGLIVGLMVGLMVQPIHDGIPWLSVDQLIFGLIVWLIAGLIVGLIVGLMRGFTYRVKVGKAFPNHGTRLSCKNSLAAFFVTWLSVGPIGGLVAGLAEGPVVGLTFGSVVGLIGGLIVGLNRGGLAVIQHYALRLTLWRSGNTPLKFVNFLDHCAKLILLKKVGGGYIFIHRMLLEYFAELTPQSKHQKQPQ